MLSMNYFPVAAMVCFEMGIPYIAWIYDSPLDVRNPEETFGYPTNYVYFFDEAEYNLYRKKGVQTVHHMELAVNTKRLDALEITEQEYHKYESDVSFVGNLYASDFERVFQLLGSYERGYLAALMDVQSQIYGTYLIDCVADEKFLLPTRECFQDFENIQKQDHVTYVKWLHHLLAAEITRRERISILSLLSKRSRVKLWSARSEKMLSDVVFCGTANAFEETAKIYRCSRINLNISLKQIQSGIPLRVLDILGAGGFLLTNYQPEIAKNFEDGKEVVMYDSIEDAVGKALYYLKHEEKRGAIAANGRRAVEKFTFEKQLTQILRDVFGENAKFI
jgi:spore maturation protein CgeB